LQRLTERTYNEFCDKLDAYLKANVDDIAAYLGALDRFDNDKERRQQAPFQKQRRWERMMELRTEGNKWIKTSNRRNWRLRTACTPC